MNGLKKLTKMYYFNNILQKLDCVGCTQSAVEMKEYINAFC